MVHLRREQAPISEAAWKEIDAEAKRVLELLLAGRKLVDFDGPHGWGASSVSLGRAARTDASLGEGVESSLRRVQPLMELRVPFELSLAELEDIDRGAADPELGPLIEAAQRLARAEDTAVFHGYDAAGIRGISDHSAHAPLAISQNYEAYPALVAEATNMLRKAGVNGPHAIALGPRCWAGLMQAPSGGGGYPVLDKIQNILDGPLIWAPAVDGAAVMSMRGGDFSLTVGQDISIGYRDHDAERVRLYLVESMTFRLITPEAAVPLRYV